MADVEKQGRGLSFADLLDQLRALGVKAGQTLLVHASLSSLGWVDGGEEAVVAALREAVGATGNIVVPTGTDENSATSRAHRARIAGMRPEQVAEYRNRMPAFDVRRSVTGAGRIAEELRSTPGAVRSGHPQSSFAAFGPLADKLMRDHGLTCHLGMRSPLGKLYHLDELYEPDSLDEFYGDGKPRAWILMIGVGYHACSALHLAEYLYRKDPPTRTYSALTTVGRRRRWTVYRDVVLDDSDFELIGDYLDKEIVVHQGDIGEAECRLLPVRDVVDYATEWMREHRH